LPCLFLGLRSHVTRTAIHVGHAASRKADAEDQSGEEAQVLVSLRHGVRGSDHVPRVNGHREPRAYQGTKNVRLSLTILRSNSSRLSNNVITIIILLMVHVMIIVIVIASSNLKL